jgi:hypothetical protein
LEKALETSPMGIAGKSTVLPPTPEKSVELIPSERIERSILLIRGHKVILDTDLAALYGVPTKRLNEQVRRNRARFPKDFLLELTRPEYDRLRSQFATLKAGRGQHRKYLPYAFTEHGALMAATVLSSPVAGHGDARYDGKDEEIQRIWGQPAWGLPTENGRSVWEDLDLVRAVRDAPPEMELPFVSMTYSEGRGSAGDLVEALLGTSRAVLTHTAWGGERLVPVSARATFQSVRLDIRRDRPILAVNAAWKPEDAVRNGSLTWRTDDIVDEPEMLAFTVRQAHGRFAGTIAIRRIQRFHLERSAACRWRIAPAGGSAAGAPGTGSAREDAGAPQDSGARDGRDARQGRVEAGAGGVLTLEGIEIPEGTHRLTIELDRGGGR